MAGRSLCRHVFLASFALSILFSVSSVVSAADDADYVSWSASSSIVFAGQNYSVNITMRNSGTTTWTAAGGYILGSQNPAGNYIWGVQYVNLSIGDSIAPGQSKTFSFTVSNDTAGTYNFQWQMYKVGSGFFGDATPNSEVAVRSVLNAYMQYDHHPFKGVGWDIYRAISGQDVDYLDDTTPQFVRHLWWIEFYQPHADEKTYDSEMAAALYTFLQHAKEKNITILLSNPNGGGYFDDLDNWPPDPTHTYWPNHYFWLSETCRNDPNNYGNRFCYRTFAGDPGICSPELGYGSGPETDHPYSNQVFAQVLAENLDYIINEKNGRVDFVSLWNEPSGDWAYHPRDAGKTYPTSFDGLYQSMYAKFEEEGLDESVQLAGSDDAFPTTGILDYAVGHWNPYVGGWSLHNYDSPVGSGGSVKYLFDRAGGKPILIGEIGHKGLDGCEDGGYDMWGNSIEATRLMISDIRYGAYAVARWWFGEGIPPKCWDTLSGDDIVPENYNSLKILANTLPQINENISVVWTDFPDLDSIDAVVINAAPQGQGYKPVLWAVNKNSQDYVVGIRFAGINQSVNFSTKYMVGEEPYDIDAGANYTMSPGNPFAAFTLPANSIFVAVGTASTTNASSLPTSAYLSVYLNEPVDESSGTVNVSFNATVVGSNLSYGCNLSLNGSLNSSVAASNNTKASFLVSNLGAGTWLWNVSCWINSTLYNHSETRTYTVTTTATTTTTTISPYLSISLSEPADESVGSGNLGFNATVIGTNQSYGCNLSLNGSVNSSIIASNDSKASFPVYNLGAGTWLWNVSCWINSTLYNHSETRTYTVTEVCGLSGDYPPCGVVTLQEVLGALDIWVANETALQEILELIESWLAA